MKIILWTHIKHQCSSEKVIYFQASWISLVFVTETNDLTRRKVSVIFILVYGAVFGTGDLTDAV